MQKCAQKVLLILAILFLATVAFSEEELAAQSAQGVEAQVITSVGVDFEKINYYDGNVLSVSFLLTSFGGSISNLNYAVMLAPQENNSEGVAFEKIFNNQITLVENEPYYNENGFVVPKYLKGKYLVSIIAKNEKGLMVASADLEEVDLLGNGNFVEIDENSCYLTIGTEQTRYFLLEGIDVLPEETLTVSCELTNHFESSVSFSPKFDTYFRTIFGEQTGSKILEQTTTLAAKETKLFSFVVPKATNPQAYDTVLSLVDESGEVVSNNVTTHYILAGLSGTVQQASLDKDYYAKGDTAKATIFWTGSALSFPTARNPTNFDGASLFVKITSNGEKCIEPAQKSIQSETETLIRFEEKIVMNCIDPLLEVALVDSTGKEIDSTTLSLTSRTTPLIPSEAARADPTILIIGCIIGVVLIGAAVVMLQKKKQKRAGRR